MPPKKRVAKTKTVKSEAKKVKTETSPLADPEPETKKVTKSMTVVGLVPVNNGDTESTWNFNAYGGVANFKVVDFATYASLCKKTPAAEIGAFHAMLNQTNIGANNNKYYLCQVLKKLSSGGSQYFTLFRWGRVGAMAGNQLNPHGNLEAAVDDFCKKFRAKSVNNFMNVCYNKTFEFEKKSGKYELIEMDYGGGQEDDQAEKEAIDDESDEGYVEPECSLKPEVQDVINLICDAKKMEEQVKQMNFDTTRSPLGKLTKEQIKKGNQILTEIETEIKAIDARKSVSTGTRGRKASTNHAAANAKSNQRLIDLTSSYYTKIPHYFGMKVPPVIKTLEHLQQEIDLLSMLADIEIVTTIIKTKKEKSKKHILDEKYEGLNCDIKKVTKKEADKIEQLLAHTHAPTHSAYKKIKLINAFKLNASTQNEASFKAHNKKHRKLLWHGTRLTNVAGILKQGLRIAPPEAPCTGYMFGKGVYFADSCSKSANYCHPNNFGGDTQRFLFLADVAIGEPHKIYGSDYNAPDRMRDHKKDSVQGVGKMNYETIGEEKFLGAYVPKINKKTSGCILKDTDTEDKTYLMYNEFIIYDTSQINLKYLCHVDFEYGGSSFW